MTSSYHATYSEWEADPEAYWGAAASSIDWFTPFERVFDPDAGTYGRWFTGGTTNTCYNCLDRHVAQGRGDQPAVIYDSPITGAKKIYSYSEFLGEVKALAAVLQDNGVTKGDRVIIYMPMIPEAAMAMLACARVGAVHSVVFGGFAGSELATRIDDAKPKLIVAASCGIEPNRIVAYKPMLDEAISLASHKPQGCLMLQREQHPAELTQGQDVDLGAAMEVARAKAATSPARRWRRPIRSTFSIRPGPPGSRRALFATMAGTWLPSTGR